jgi:hypothetical protein
VSFVISPLVSSGSGWEEVDASPVRPLSSPLYYEERGKVVLRRYRMAARTLERRTAVGLDVGE